MLRAKNWSLFALLLLFTSLPSISSEMTISTWNIEWLTSAPSNRFTASLRSEEDFFALRRHFKSMDSKVIAFQEVNDAKALKQVVGQDYQLFFSQRSQKDNSSLQFDNINQYTGFAVKRGITVVDKPDVKLDNNPNSKLRFASYIVFYPHSNEPIHALSVHLKVRCSGAYNTSRDCRTLKQQGQSLNKWIKSRERRRETYIVLGDFNHNLNFHDDWLWKVIAKGTDATLASNETKALCKVKSRNNPQRTHQFRSLIDHVVTSKGLNISKPIQNLFPMTEVLKYQLSDHCPMSFTL